MKLDKPMEISAANIALLTMDIFINDDLQSAIDELTEPFLEQSKIDKKNAEMERVEQTNDAAELVDLMRKINDMAARDILCKKILDNQQEAMPLVLKRFRTSTFDGYIENAIIILAHCDEQYVVKVQ